MSEQNEVLEALKAEADDLGIEYSPNIGAEKLQQRITAHLESQAGTPEASEPESTVSEAVPAKQETEAEKRLRIKKMATELIRVNVTCMNPNKREWEGEIFTTGNGYTGTIRKMVPFGVDWHVPRMLVNMIKARHCQIFETKKDDKGRKRRVGRLIPEFNVIELPKMTEKEIEDLARQQAMSGGLQ